MRFIVGCLCLLLATMAMASDRYSVIEIMVTTGNDDLRENSRAEIVIRMQDGRELRQLLHRAGERLADRTQKNTSLNFAPAIALNALDTVSVVWTRDGGDVIKRPDEWEMAELRLSVRNARNEVTTFFVAPRRKFVESGTFVLDNMSRTSGAAICTSDRECDDGRFCTGVERCAPGSTNADARGCVASRNPVCSSGLICDEELNRCKASTACVDNDGDGVTAMHCGGSDCDDNDPNRYPGNVEIWDTRNHDEDCVAETTGINNTALANQSPQVCSGRKVMVLSSPPRTVSCSGVMVCIPQPNGSGVCGVEPAGYQTPAEIVLPTPSADDKPTLPLPTTIKLPKKQK